MNLFLRIILIIFCFGRLPLFAQYNLPENSVWVLGRNAGYNFNQNASFRGQLNAAECSGAVSDQDGNLLFYTDGSRIWNRNHLPMPSASPLFPEPFSDATQSTVQGTLIVPVTDNANRYYVFSLFAQETAANAGGQLYYSVVDMTLNNGLGDVMPTGGPILVDTGLTEHMIAIPACEAVWIVVHNRNSPEFKSFRIDASGVSNTPVLSVTGVDGFRQPWSTSSYNGNNFYNIGQMVVSNDFSKIAAAYFFGNCLELYNFNSLTGNVSAIGIVDTINDTYSFYGVAFSPDDSRLYAANCAASVFNKAINQYDLTQPSITQIRSSRTFIASARSSITQLQLGPDGKIYFNGGFISRMGVIHYPNLLGTACGLEENAIELVAGTNAAAGFHNTFMKPVRVSDTVFTAQAYSSGCFRTTATISASNLTGSGYTWSTGVIGQQLTVDTPGRFWVHYYTAPCRYHVDTFDVEIKGPLPELQALNSCNELHNGKAWINTPDSSDILYSFSWRRAGDTAVLSVTDSLTGVPSDNYNVTIITSSGCDTILHFSIGKDNYQVAFTMADTIACVGEPVAFQNSSDAYYSAFHWNFGDGVIAGIYSPEHSYTESGTYVVTLAGAGELCVDTFQKIIIVDDRTEGLFFEAGKKDICTGEQIRLSTLMQDNTLLHLIWNLGDGSVLTTNEVAVSIEHAYDKEGLFPISLTAKSRACPDISFTDSIRVHTFPQVSLGDDSVICLKDAAVTLQNRYPHSDGYHYLWNTGSASPQLTIAHEGVYRLKVSNTYGCTTAESIRVAKDCYGNLPNAFTPNGDGVNDHFYPHRYLSSGITSFYMEIFNKWGQQIFITTSKDGRGWDGKFNGKDQPAGVYIYRIEIGLENGRQEKYEGNVTLIR